MSQLELFIDPYESEYPSLVREVLTQSPKKTTTCATLTIQNQCVLLCNNFLFIWNYNNKDCLIPHAYKLNLPYTGIKYSVESFCIFKRAERKLSSVLVVSPEGCVRFWPEIGKPPTDQNVQLNGEIAFSLTLIDATESVYRFLISTSSTTNFFIVEIFYALNEQSENLTFKPIEMNSLSGIGRRMSMLLFGFSTEKESVRRTLFVRDSPSSRALQIDIVIVLSKSLKFFSLSNQTLLYEISINDLFLESFAQIQANYNELLSPTQNSVKIIDAALYQNGILILLGVFSADNTNNPLQTDFYLGYLKERKESLKNLDRLVPIFLPDYITQLEHKDVLKCRLYVPNNEECVILFPSSILLIQKPTVDNMETSFLDDIGDSILGAANVNGICHVILKEAGVSSLRRLPERFDLNFYKKYREGLKQLVSEDSDYSDELFANAFICFCNKDLKKSKDFVEKLAQEPDVNYSDLTVDLAKIFVDRPPIDRSFDPRWSTETSGFTHEQKLWMKEHASAKSLALITQHLENKLAHYRMLTLFLKHFNLLQKLNRLVRSFNNRSGIAALAELGEKLFLAGICVRWLNGEPVALGKYGPQLPPASLITGAIQQLGLDFMRKFRHPENSYLTENDYFFNEVSSFHELIPLVVKVCEKRINEQIETEEGDSTKFCGIVILNCCAFLTIIAKGVELAHKQPWAVETSKDSPTWLNQGHFFSYFVRHLNKTLSYLAGSGDCLENEDENEIYENDSNDFEGGISDDDSEAPVRKQTIISGVNITRSILDQAVCMAKFVLSQQNRYQRDNSQVIIKFYEIGWKILALRLAEEFQDFTMLIEYSLKNLSEKECRIALEHYKKKFCEENFDLFLFDYYRKKGMVNWLLAEKGNRLNDYLSDHKTINWIRNIDNGEYKKARETLKTMAFETTDQAKKMIELSLCKLCVLCDEVENVDELAELSENIRILSEIVQV